MVERQCIVAPSSTVISRRLEECPTYSYRAPHPAESCPGDVHPLSLFAREDWLTCNRDFDAPIDPPRPADVSAANLAAYALLVLSEQEASINNATGAKYYADAAINVGEARSMAHSQSDV